MLVVGHWRVFMSKQISSGNTRPAIWSHHPQIQIHTPINDQAAPTQALTPEEGTRGLNPRNIVRKQVNMANWPIFVVWNKGVLFESWNRDLPCSRIMSNGLQTIIKHRAHGRGATSRRNARGRRRAGPSVPRRRADPPMEHFAG